MSWMPPGSQPYGSPQGAPPPPPSGSRVIKLIITVIVAAIAIPALAYGVFLVAVLLVSYFAGPIRWN